GDVRAAAGEAREAVGGSRGAREGGVRAVMEQRRGLLLRRGRRAGWTRRRAEAEPDLRRVASREPALSRAPAQGRERLRPASPHVLRPQEPRARPPAVPGPLRRRSAPARRRLPPGHGLGVAPRSVRARSLQGPPRREGGARVPGAARAPPRRLRHRLHRRDLRWRLAVRARGLHRAGVERRRDAARLARARCGARRLRCVRYYGGPTWLTDPSASSSSAVASAASTRR